MTIFIPFLIGLLFGLGLIVAGMANPAKVLNFLDLAGLGTTFDASLAFVLLGATTTTFLGYRLVLRRERPLMGGSFLLPKTTGIDRRLIVGPAIFGLGWGLAGFCPGPALVALGTGTPAAALFVAAMIAGMAGARWLASRG